SLALACSVLEAELRSSRTPVHVQVSRICANTLFNFSLSRTLDQFPGSEPPRFSADSSGNVPVADFLAFAQRSMRKCQANAIVCKAKVLCRFGRAIWSEPFRQTGIVPIGGEHER